MENLEELGKICGSSKKAPGLISKIEVARECKATIPAANNYVHASYDVADSATHPHTISGDIVLEAPEAFKALNFRDNAEAIYETNEEGDEDAEEQVVTISFFRPTIDNFTTWLMDVISKDRVVVKFWDKGASDAYPRLVGETGNGAKVVVKEQARPKNGYMVTITCRMRKKPYWYAGA